MLSDGSEIKGDIVLSAIGLRPRISLAKEAGLAVNRGIVVDKTLAGDGLDRVYTVNDLMDYAKFQQAATGKKNVIVVGGGLIGCEYANDLSNGGYSAQLIEPVGRVLPALLPPVASQAVGSALEGLGVKFHIRVS